MFALALATQISLYPCLLFPPLAMLAAQQRNQNVSFKTFASPAVAFTASSALLMLLSRSYLGSWAFLDMYRVMCAFLFIPCWLPWCIVLLTCICLPRTVSAARI